MGIARPELNILRIIACLMHFGIAPTGEHQSRSANGKHQSHKIPTDLSKCPLPVPALRKHRQLRANGPHRNREGVIRPTKANSQRLRCRCVLPILFKGNSV